MVGGNRANGRRVVCGDAWRDDGGEKGIWLIIERLEVSIPKQD